MSKRKNRERAEAGLIFRNGKLVNKSEYTSFVERVKTEKKAEVKKSIFKLGIPADFMK